VHRDKRRAVAFAEGRRQRRAAERRRALRRRAIARAVHRRPMLQMLLLPVVALLITAIAASIAAAIAFIAVIGAVVGPALLVGGTTFVVVRHRRRRALTRAAAAPPHPPWEDAHARFAALAAAYAAYECDPMAVLHRPALSDVRVPSTARFVDAFSHAQALDTDAHPGDEHAAAYATAVDAAERAWRAATEAADRIRLSGLSADERASVERVIKLLTVARDSGNEAERLAAYSRARSELHRLDAAGVVHVPGLATATLERAARGALPA
jgi:hypothetical protein